jgi:hypothetical protein
MVDILCIEINKQWYTVIQTAALSFVMCVVKDEGLNILHHMIIYLNSQSRVMTCHGPSVHGDSCLLRRGYTPLPQAWF